ncbi:MAG TPA: hypothetical protein VN709_04015 [Terriglobales bacterium]|nr:hypothetical protein [Terriglobales bacterium]
MPVSRAYIAPFATSDGNQFQAFTDLANFVDALEAAIGVRLGSGARASAPAPASWTITAADGHVLIQISNPTGSGVQPAPQPMVQHQIASSASQTFDPSAGTTTYTLGMGETTRDIVDPGVTKYWRLQSRLAGSAWNGWRMYATSAGVVPVATGALKIS